MKVVTGTIASPQGFYADGQHVGLKNKKKDLGWLYSIVPAQAAGVFTTNQVQAAPIILTKKGLSTGVLQGVIVNSGNANACTGQQGLLDAKEMQELTGEALGIDPSLVAVASTGVIGKLMPMATVAKGIQQLKQHEGDATGFHEAILTTDTGTKEVVISHFFGETEVLMAGVSKGSGMIHPNMATMLGFITTDAVIKHNVLQQALKEVIEVTFNQITVDGDTSTNDMVLVLANGESKGPEIKLGTSDYDHFKGMLQLVCETLAKKIAKDGEGATKLIEVEVNSATDEQGARMMAKEVVGSSLVKTAIFGEDPNWGRIICAMGYSEVSLNPDTVSIDIGPVAVFKAGMPIDFDVAMVQEYLTGKEIKIMIQLNQGDKTGTAWGCDLSYDYVKINALYHT